MRYIELKIEQQRSFEQKLVALPGDAQAVQHPTSAVPARSALVTG
jgi:hypothetical protein